MQGPRTETFAGILERQAARRSGDRAFVFLDRRGNAVDERTYASLRERAQTIASALTQRGLAGRPVLLNFPSGLEFVDALFGCFYAGAIAVPAPYAIGKRSAERIASICRDCGPAAALTLSAFRRQAQGRDEIPPELDRIPSLCVDTLAPAPEPTLPSVPSADVALLQYTSGSTSAPKGVMLSHDNLVANGRMIRDMLGHGPELRGVGWLPLFHDMGLIGHVLQPVLNGGLSVLMSPLTFLQRPLTWLEAISTWRATTSGGPTYAFEQCVERISAEQAARLDLSSWRVAYCGSEPIRAEALARFAAKLAPCGLSAGAMYTCYGLAEATLMVTSGRAEEGCRIDASSDAAHGAGRPRVVASSGRPCRGLTVAVVDPERGRAVPPGEAGEIWVGGPSVARGYWGRPSETEAVFGARLEPHDGTFVRTGDLGFLRDGQLFVVGRMKDMIIVRGTNHAPEDIESTVAGCHVRFAGHPQAAFGVDVSGSEHVVVVQEIKPGAGDADEAAAAAFERVTRDHGLRLYDFVLVRPGAIPRTSSGKVRRGRCRELYLTRALRRCNDAAALGFLGANVEARAALTNA